MVYKKYKHSPVRKYREGLDDITDKLDSLTLNKKKMKINLIKINLDYIFNFDFSKLFYVQSLRITFKTLIIM